MAAFFIYSYPLNPRPLPFNPDFTIAKSYIVGWRSKIRVKSHKPLKVMNLYTVVPRDVTFSHVFACILEKMWFT